MPPPRKCDCGTCQRCKHRVYMQAWYWRNRDKACVTARATRLRRIEEAQAYDRERGCRTDPEKHKIRSRTRRLFPEVQPCEVCGEPGQRHHFDYSRPEEISWLCTIHHGHVHRSPAPF